MNKSEKKKITVYPEPFALEVLGDKTPELNQAIGAFAYLVKVATSQLPFERNEWNLLADVLNGTWIYETMLSTTILSMSVADGIQLDGLDEKWGVDGAALLEKINSLTPIGAWAVICAVNFFWQDKTIDHDKDEWWTIEFRKGRFERNEETQKG